MQRHGGAIINVSDIAGHKPWGRFPIHSISKAGVEMLTRVAALRLAPSIRVNAVAPGPVLKPESMTQARWEEIGRTLPLQRPGSPQDAVAAVLFLLESDFITGATLVVDGGDLIV
jgi:pteridine reductase